MIDIKGLNKAEVLKALYDGSHIQGIGSMQAVPDGFVTVEHCQQLLEETAYPYFDYLYGRVMKVDLSKDEFEERLYDRDNGQGAAARIIDRLRNGNANAPKTGTCRMDLTRLKIEFACDSGREFPNSIIIRYGNLIIGYDFTNGKDQSVLIVGTQKKGEAVTIVNAFQGEDARAMYELLTTKKKGGE